MTGKATKPAILRHLVLALLLISAQAGAAMHAAEHEFAAPAGKVCSTCVAAEQLSAAAVGSSAIVVAIPSCASPRISRDADVAESPAPTPESRGPPATE